MRHPRPAWLALLLLCGGAASAQVTATSEYVARMDGDGDARVSLAEYQAWMMYAFTEMDRDGDGVLGTSELPGGRGKPITRQVQMQRLAERFRLQDADGNGALDARELAAPPRASSKR